MSSFPLTNMFQNSQNHQADSFFKVPSGKRLHNYGKSMNITIYNSPMLGKRGNNEFYGFHTVKEWGYNGNNFQ